ncbi:DUF6545 domain-containing protein [Nonomuraea sp. NPDC046570]|uniref:DUF6545 domain-containing protein n=1 Tax=Nonomuraea sp. NPDC046570 TaxID=3155255 RepID=UPI0033F18D55
MRSALIVACLAIMWTITLMRMPGMRRSPQHLMIWLALTSGIISISIGQTALSPWLTSLSGTPALPFFLETSLVVIALASAVTWEMIASVGSGDLTWRRRIRYPWYVAVPIIICFAALAFGNDLSSSATYTAVGQQQATTPQLLYLGVYETYVIVVFVIKVTMFFRLAHICDRVWLRRGWHILAWASVGCATRSVYTMSFLIPQVTGLPAPNVPWSTELSISINLPFYTVGFIGIALPALDLLAQWLRPRRALWILRPLWTDLQIAFPDLVRVRREFDTASAELVARETVINEGLFKLRTLSSSDVLLLARAYAVTAAVPAQRLESVTYAAWITYAMAHPDGTAATTKIADWPSSPRAGETDWLIDIAREYNYASVLRRIGLAQGFVNSLVARAMQLAPRESTPP